uniref:Uncharacterized protein n=1 Tax=Arundo donax TaxID=35708 RepID=A0A0A9GKE8_ARUDO
MQATDWHNIPTKSLKLLTTGMIHLKKLQQKHIQLGMQKITKLLTTGNYIHASHY